MNDYADWTAQNINDLFDEFFGQRPMKEQTNENETDLARDMLETIGVKVK